MKVIEIHADEIRPGDVVDYGGHLHRVSHVDHLAGWSWPVASDDNGWAIALGDDVVGVLRPAGVAGNGWLLPQRATDKVSLRTSFVRFLAGHSATNLTKGRSSSKCSPSSD